MRARARLFTLLAVVALVRPAVAQDFSGTWVVQGNDPARGAYTGTASVKAAPGGYKVERLVAFATRLPGGRELLQAWNVSARNEAGGLRADATLRRANIGRRVGSLARTVADQTPLAVTGLLKAQAPLAAVPLGTAIAGTFGAQAETWTRTNLVPPPFPRTDATLVDTHSPPNALLKLLLFQVFSSFHKLPALAPYASRPDFKRAVKALWVDRSAFDFYRAHGAGVVVVTDGVVDEISIAEEGRRADAFSRRLAEKIRLFEGDVKNEHLDANGMIAPVDPASPASRTMPQSVGLWSGLYGASELYRWRATGEQEALDNLARVAKGCAICVDICPNKDEFARGIDFLSNAPPSYPAATGKYSFAPGSGPYANLIWMRGGNNDILHGLEFAFLAAEQAFPQGHPLRAEVGKQAASLLDHVKEAQSGNHELFLSAVAAKTTGDPRHVKRYQRSLGWRNVLQKLYIRYFGNGLVHVQGISDWSGHNLDTVTFQKIWLLGAGRPDPLERSWHDAANGGIAVGWKNTAKTRNGGVAAAAAFAGVPGAAAQLRELLAEIPYPKTTGALEIDHSVSAAFCLSPYPSLPWKLDWMTNAGRIEALFGQPIFYRGLDDNTWSRSPFASTAGPSTLKTPGQEYLMSYWFGRASGVLTPAD